jgi:alginate O-acetyltransferase complex protein AlgI
MRFCLGFGKWVLLVGPLWHLSSMVMRGGTDSLSTGVAWMGFLARLLSLHFVFTSAGDLIAGLGGMMGFKVEDKVQSLIDLRRFTHGNLSGCFLC